MPSRCRPPGAALISIGIFLAIFRANPHLGLYSGIAALIVWGLTMAGLARALQEVGDLVKVGDDVVAKADQAKTSAPGKNKAAPDEPEAALIGNWFKRRERGFPHWIPYLFDLVAAIPAAAGLELHLTLVGRGRVDLLTGAPRAQHRRTKAERVEPVGGVKHDEVGAVTHLDAVVA